MVCGSECVWFAELHTSCTLLHYSVIGLQLVGEVTWSRRVDELTLLCASSLFSSSSLCFFFTQAQLSDHLTKANYQSLANP